MVALLQSILGGRISSHGVHHFTFFWGVTLPSLFSLLREEHILIYARISHWGVIMRGVFISHRVSLLYSTLERFHYIWVPYQVSYSRSISFALFILLTHKTSTWDPFLTYPPTLCLRGGEICYYIYFIHIGFKPTYMS
jgi:hypothetical protein